MTARLFLSSAARRLGEGLKTWNAECDQGNPTQTTTAILLTSSEVKPKRCADTRRLCAELNQHSGVGLIHKHHHRCPYQYIATIETPSQTEIDRQARTPLLVPGSIKHQPSVAARPYVASPPMPKTRVRAVQTFVLASGCFQSLTMPLRSW